ncbi:complex I NDUFA9 subunit family protein [Methyloversatilis thermotolerans]|uniref:complex I NDUFA9 subunit family protein n=1 Tax=Methyloversatilis thermotolerans TaxID=1346290 RepID=UPI0003641941|nr:complex I NDUFA9 subunit family protein [Methyloversatilis thermotolerans]
MFPNTVLLIGGSGFVGSHVASLLAERNVRMVVPTRRRDRAKHLILLPMVDVVDADVHDPVQLARLMHGVDAVVNCVGILHSRSGQPWGRDFERAHVALPRAVAAAAQAAGVRRVVHVSALGAADNAPSGYLRSKAAGETAVRASGVDWTVFRPSLIYGNGQCFLRLFASLLKKFPVMPLAGADTRYQPVSVRDVARCIVHALGSEEAIGQTYSLCGPRVYTMRELVKMTGRAIGSERCVIGLPGPLAQLQALALELAPGPTLMSRDNLRSMQVDSVCEAGCSLPFGFAPAILDNEIADCLVDFRPTDRFELARSRAHR